MAANLVGTYTSDEAHHLLNLSFAQYQSDRDVVRLETRTDRVRTALEEARAHAVSPYGDIWAYRRELESRRRERREAEDAVERALAALRPGDVVRVSKGRYRGIVAVAASAHRKTGMRLTTITRQADVLLLTASDFPDVPVAVGAVKLPGAFAPNKADYRKDVARALARVKTSGGSRRRPEGDPGTHPVERDPDLRARLRAAGQAERLERELAELARRVEGHQDSLAQDFDRVLAVLGRRGYVDQPAWVLTERGRVLARVFHESDLLVCECLHQGVFDDVDPPALAGLLSTFVYEHRSPDPPAPPWFPSSDVRARWRRVQAMSEDLAGDERATGLAEHRPPDPGFAAAAYAWVSGEELADVVEDEELTGGDFVRTMKQLVDLARQLALVAPVESTRRRARELAEVAFRGVVADVPAGVSDPDTPDDAAETA
jgi:ATP-dependent RNA helicase HelY